MDNSSILIQKAERDEYLKQCNSRMTKFGVKYVVTLTVTTKNNMEDNVVIFVKGKGLMQSLNFEEMFYFTVK